MITTRLITRYFHLHNSYFAVEKSVLATLRKKTGYTFANCKKALELHNNDISKAEHWLKQQAQELGWSKATKLEGRLTSQGLIAVAINKNNATLVEVNCETDFVARNQEFKKIVEEAAASSLSWTENEARIQGAVTKIHLDSNQLKGLKTRDGKTLADHLALMIGTVGENASLKRALCLKADHGVHLSGYTHPSSTECKEGIASFGRVGGVVALKQLVSNDIDLNELGKNICQHVVGMNPKKIGNSDDDKPAKDKDDETCLIYQEYLLDDSITVKELLEENQVEVVDFSRFECGENVEEVIRNEPLEMLNTCQ